VKRLSGFRHQPVSDAVLTALSADWREMRQLDGRGVSADMQQQPSDQWMEEYIHPDEHSNACSRRSIWAVQTPRKFEWSIASFVRERGTLGWDRSQRAITRSLTNRGEIREWLGTADTKR
jgi:hypothetical protein